MVDRFDGGAVIVRLPEQLQALRDRVEREAVIAVVYVIRVTVFNPRGVRPPG